MKNKIRTIVVMLVAVLLLGSIPVYADNEPATLVDSGTCCAGLIWKYYSDGTAVIEGKGALYKDSAISDLNMKASKIVISEGITHICEETFMPSEVLIEVVVPSSVVYIGDRAFAYSMANLNVILPEEGLVEIGDYAFENTDLKNFKIPSTVHKIGNGVFSTSGLEGKLVIPDSVESIGEYAFAFNKLTEVYIPASTTTIRGGVFAGNQTLEKINIADENRAYSSPEKNDVIMTGTTLIAGCKNASIPEGTTWIDADAFAWNLEDDIVIPDSVKEINSSAFAGCGMKNITIPDGVEIIMPSTFIFCENLSQVDIPFSVSRICKGAFKGCESLKAVEVPYDAVIEEDAFESYTEIIRKRFSDVGAGQVSSGQSKSISWAVSKGIIKGYSDNTFRPQNPCTRGQFVTMLWRTAGRPEAAAGEKAFTDVSADMSSARAIGWAQETGIIKGYKDGTFRPSEPLTRQQIAVILWRMLGRPQAYQPGKQFTDVNDQMSAYRAIYWASSKDLVRGYADGRFGANDNCTRAQLVTILYRAADKNSYISIK